MSFRFRYFRIQNGIDARSLKPHALMLDTGIYEVGDPYTLSLDLSALSYFSATDTDDFESASFSVTAEIANPIDGTLNAKLIAESMIQKLLGVSGKSDEIAEYLSKRRVQTIDAVQIFLDNPPTPEDEYGIMVENEEDCAPEEDDLL